MTNAQPWPAVAVLLMVGVVAGAGLAVLVSSLARRRGGGDTQRRRLATLTFVVVVAFFLLLAMGRLMDPRLAEAALGAVAARVIRTAPDVLAAVIIVAAGIIAGSALSSLLRRRVTARPGLAAVTARIATWTVIAVAVLVAAAQVGIAVGVVERILLVVVGGVVLAAAVGVGLGSRHMVAAVIEGRHVAEIIQVGDEVEVDGVRGRVLALGRASVRIGVDGAEAEVPNTRFLDGAVFVHHRQR